MRNAHLNSRTFLVRRRSELLQILRRHFKRRKIFHFQIGGERHHESKLLSRDQLDALLLFVENRFISLIVGVHPQRKHPDGRKGNSIWNSRE